jgi:hypothetical protein
MRSGEFCYRKETVIKMSIQQLDDTENNNDKYDSTVCIFYQPKDYRAHSFGPFYTKKREISHTFAQKKCELLSWSSFGQFCHKVELFSKARAISRF